MKKGLNLKDSIRKELYVSPKGYKITQYIFECKVCKKETKTCRLCNTERYVNEFYDKGRHKKSECKRCTNLYRNFKINARDYDIMFNNQKGRCAICETDTSHNHQNGNVTKLAVDHCHTTGEIRGLLCSKCNRGIGYLQDNINNLKNAVKYLSKGEEHETKV